MKNAILILVVTLMSISCAQNQGRIPHAAPESVGMNSKHLEQVDEAILQSIKRGDMPGAVLSVVKDGKIVYLKAYGNKQVVPDTVPMTVNTVFDMASVSKCVGTTLSIMQLIENGKIRLTDPVRMYIRGFQPWINPETGEKTDIRIVDLLTHASGIQAYINVPAFVDRFGEGQPDSLIKFIARELPLRYAPTTDYTYSCLNFITLQNVLQNVTGLSLAEYANTNVFGALKLNHTTYLPLEPAAREKALSRVDPDILSLVAPTEVQADGKPLIGEVHDPIARIINLGNSGNAGVFSDAEDLSVIAAAIMNGGEINGCRILSPLTIETMITFPKENNPDIERCLGWDSYTYGAGTKGDIFLTHPHTICHTGYTGTSMLLDMDTKCAVILLSNRVHPLDKGGLGRVRALVANIVAGSFTK